MKFAKALDSLAALGEVAISKVDRLVLLYSKTFPNLRRSPPLENGLYLRIKLWRFPFAPRSFICASAAGCRARSPALIAFAITTGTTIRAACLPFG